MINYHKELVAALETVLPTYYEMILHKGIETPCISYMETNNYQITESIGAPLGYSRVTFQVKIWAKDIALIQQYIPEVDRVMRALGFKRISSNELYDNNSTMIQKILTYEAIGLENYE